MNLFHYNINLPTPFIPYERDYNTFEEISMNRDSINPEFLRWLDELNIYFNIGKFFHSPPYRRYNPHVDGPSVGCVKLNLVFDSCDTIMNWYKPNLGYVGYTRDNTTSEQVKHFDKSKLTTLYTAPVNGHCILNGGIVHDLVNGANQGRFRKCYSLFLFDSQSEQRLTWAAAYTRFKPYLVEV